MASTQMISATRIASLLLLFLITVEGKTKCLEWDIYSSIDPTRNNLIYQTPDHNEEDLGAKEIVSKMLEKLKGLLKNGDAEHGVPSIDPQVFSISHSIEEENLQVTMSFDGQITNSSNLFWDSMYTCPLTMQAQMQLTVEDISVDGTYNLTGMAYEAFPIFGDGDFKVDIDKIRLLVTAEVSPRRGDYPLEMYNLNVHFLGLQGLKMNFENLMGDDDVALLLSHLASDISEKMAYNFVSNMEEAPNAVLYGIVADQISNVTLLDIVSFIENMM